MPRSARIIPPESWFHVLSRGNNRQTLFRSEEDFQHYLRLLEEYRGRYGLRLAHYCLMSNHIHLLVFSAKGDDLTKAMQGIQLSYNWWVRRRYGFVGHLWQGRFKSFLVQKESYLMECGRYIERNPFYAQGCPDRWVSLTPDPGYLALASVQEERRRLYRNYVEMDRPYEFPDPERLHPVFQGW